MKGLKKCIGAVTAAALFITALPVNGISQAYAAGEGTAAQTVDVDVTVQPNVVSKFHDTDGDGLGEFEGWAPHSAGGQTVSVTVKS